MVLERAGDATACEISITTTIDHEVRNIAKCLKAGFPKVAVICIDGERLQKIAAAVVGSLGLEAASRVLYCEPDQFIAPSCVTRPSSVRRRTPVNLAGMVAANVVRGHVSLAKWGNLPHPDAFLLGRSRAGRVQGWINYRRHQHSPKSIARTAR